MTRGVFRTRYLAALVWTFVSVVSSSAAFAQIDPASGMLLDTTGRPSSGHDGAFDSGRYTVRPKAVPKKTVSTQAPKPSSTPIVVATPSPTPSPPPAPVVEANASAEATAMVAAPVATPAATPQPTATPQLEVALPSPSPTPSVAPQAQPEISEAEKKPKFDRRSSLLELSISPVYIYSDSQSSYWYRSYFTSSPGAHLNANVWLSDSFGLHTSFLTSLSASVTDSTNQSRVVSVSQNWFDLGVRFRHFASAKPKSSALVLGLDWSEYRFNTSTTALMRQRLSTSGAQATAGLEFPTSKNYMWTADVSLIPKAKHQELETRTQVQSGTANETNSFGASLGGVIRIDSGNAYFWRLSHKVEKNVFSGTATAADPVSGITPTGVSVTNSTTFLEIGCTWGD